MRKQSWPRLRGRIEPAPRAQLKRAEESDNPAKTKALLRLLIAEIAVVSREEIQPTYRKAGLTGHWTNQTKVRLQGAALAIRSLEEDYSRSTA